jgi:hypothetical protein
MFVLVKAYFVHSEWKFILQLEKKAYKCLIIRQLAFRKKQKNDKKKLFDIL